MLIGTSIWKFYQTNGLTGVAAGDAGFWNIYLWHHLNCITWIQFIWKQSKSIPVIVFPAIKLLRYNIATLLAFIVGSLSVWMVCIEFKTCLKHIATFGVACLHIATKDEKQNDHRGMTLPKKGCSNFCSLFVFIFLCFPPYSSICMLVGGKQNDHPRILNNKDQPKNGQFNFLFLFSFLFLYLFVFLCLFVCWWSFLLLVGKRQQSDWQWPPRDSA